MARCWNLEKLDDYCTGFILRYRPSAEEHQRRLVATNEPAPAECFGQRFMLFHEYRSSPYVEPNLPLELLPDGWLGLEAAQLFRQYHDLLSEGAESFVDEVLARAPSKGAVQKETE